MAVILIVLLMPYFSALVVTQPRSTNADFGVPSSDQNDPPTFSAKVIGAPISLDWRSYHNYTSLVNLLTTFDLSYPDIIDIFVIGETWQGRDIFCIRITDERVNNATKQQVLIISEHHAREFITLEASLYLAWYLLDTHQNDINIQKLLISKEIYIIPCLNPDGLESALTDDPFHRKNMHPIDDDGDGVVDEDIVMDLNGNGQLECYQFDTNLGTSSDSVWTISDMAYEGNATRGDGVYSGFISDNPGGVDLNRNYGFHFNDTYETSSNSTNPRVEDYKGSAPFSEPETRAIKQLVESHRFLFAMSLHSGTEVLLREWSYTSDISSLGANFTLFNMFGKIFEQSSGYPYWIGKGDLGYNCSGEFGDWMYGVRKIPTMTCEIYGNASAYEQRSVSANPDEYIWWGVRNYFNPPASMILNICMKTLRFLLQVVSITNYSSLRTTSTTQRSMVLNDGSNTLTLTWNYGGVQDTAVASFAFLPFEADTGSRSRPISNVFSVLSDGNIRGMRLSLDYRHGQLNATGADERDIAILVWDVESHQWSKLESPETDTERNRITVVIENDMLANTPYYFVLAPYSTYAMPNGTAIFLVVMIGITVALIVATIMKCRRIDSVTPAQSHVAIRSPSCER